MLPVPPRSAAAGLPPPAPSRTRNWLVWASYALMLTLLAGLVGLPLVKLLVPKPRPLYVAFLGWGAATALFYAAAFRLWQLWRDLPAAHPWRRRVGQLATALGWLHLLLWASLLFGMIWAALDASDGAVLEAGMSVYWLKSAVVLAAVPAATWLLWIGFRRFERWRTVLSILLVLAILALALDWRGAWDEFREGFEAGAQASETGQNGERTIEFKFGYNQAAAANASAQSPTTAKEFLFVLMFAIAAATGIGSAARLRNREESLQIAKLEADNQRERLGRELAESQLKLLQAQIEPHFLFNTLGALQQRAEGRAPEAAALAADLIRFLRGSMDNLRTERTTLGDDFRLAAAYLNVMQARMGGRLRFELALPEALAARQVPTLMLLTLVENALKHGIEPHPPGGEVRIAAREDGGQLVLEVADTGRGMSDLPGSGTGLDNIRKRLQLQYGAAARLELEENEPQGFVARIRLPLAEPAAAGEDGHAR